MATSCLTGTSLPAPWGFDTVSRCPTLWEPAEERSEAGESIRRKNVSLVQIQHALGQILALRVQKVGLQACGAAQGQSMCRATAATGTTSTQLQKDEAILQKLLECLRFPLD